MSFLAFEIFLFLFLFLAELKQICPNLSAYFAASYAVNYFSALGCIPFSLPAHQVFV